MYSRSSAYDSWRAPPYDSRRRDSPPRRRSRSRDRNRERHRSSRSQRTRSRSRSPMAVHPKDDRSRLLRDRMETYRSDVQRLNSRQELVDFLWKSGIEPLSDDEKPTLFNEVASVKPGIVGVDALFQVICCDNPSLETYFCSMCMWWTTASDMFGHLVSYPHRLAHLHRNHINLHKTVLDEADMRKRTGIVAYFADQLTQTEGSGQISCRLRCVLSMKIIRRLWPDFEMYMDNAWKLTDITNAIITRNNNTLAPSGPFGMPPSVDGMTINPWESRRDRSRSPPPPRKRRRSRSRSRSPPGKSWEEKAAMFLKEIGATNEAKTLVTPQRVNPHKPPGVDAYQVQQAQADFAAPKEQTCEHDMSLDDRLQAFFPGTAPPQPQMCPPVEMINPVSSEPSKESPPKKMNEGSKEMKKPDDESVGVRKLLGFIVTLQQEVEDRGQVDPEAMKRLCREIGIKESNLEKAYTMLNDFSSKFIESSPKKPVASCSSSIMSSFQVPKPPDIASEYGQCSAPETPVKSTSLENLGLSTAKLRNLVNQAQNPAPEPVVSALPPPPVPPQMFYEQAPLRPTMQDSGGYVPVQKLPAPVESPPAGTGTRKPTVDVSRFKTSFDKLNTYNPPGKKKAKGSQPQAQQQQLSTQVQVQPPLVQSSSRDTKSPQVAVPLVEDQYSLDPPLQSTADWSYGWQGAQQQLQSQGQQQMNQNQVRAQLSQLPPPTWNSGWQQPSQEPAGGLPSDWHSGWQLGQPQQEPRKSTPTPPPRVSGWPTGWQSHLQPTPPPPRPSFHQQKPQPQQFVPIQRLPQPVPPPSVPTQQVQPEVIEINSDEELEPVAEPVVPVPAPKVVPEASPPPPPAPPASVSMSFAPTSSSAMPFVNAPSSIPLPDLPPPPPPPPPPMTMYDNLSVPNARQNDVGFFENQTPPPPQKVYIGLPQPPQPVEVRPNLLPPPPAMPLIPPTPPKPLLPSPASVRPLNSVNVRPPLFGTPIVDPTMVGTPHRPPKPNHPKHQRFGTPYRGPPPPQHWNQPPPVQGFFQPPPQQQQQYYGPPVPYNGPQMYPNNAYPGPPPPPGPPGYGRPPPRYGTPRPPYGGGGFF